MTKLIKTINSLRHKAQSLIDVGPFPRNDQKKSFEIILAVNKSIFRNIAPTQLLERFDKLFSHPGHLRVAKISMFAMVYKVDDSAFHYAFVSNLSQLRNFLLFPTQEKITQLTRSFPEGSLIVKGLKEYKKKTCRRFILVTETLETDKCWFTMKNWVNSRMNIRKCLLFCQTEEQKKTIGKETIEEVFTFEELGVELARIKETVDFEVENEPMN